MIEIIEGRGVGAGKSYFAIEMAMLHWLQGGTCCMSDSIVVKWDECVAYAERRAGKRLERDQYRTISAADLVRLHEVTPPGSPELPVKIFVDEAQTAFNARDYGDGMRPGQAKRAFFDWLCQSRHDDNDVIILSQASANVDKQVRRLVTYYWVVRNTEFFPVGGKPLAHWLRMLCFGLWDGRCFIRSQLDQDGRTPLSKCWKRGDRGLYRCYESKAMRLKHRRSGEAVARKKLESVKKRRSPVFKYLFVVALVLGVGGLFVLGKHGFFPKAKMSPAPPGESVPGARPVERLYVNGEVLREELRAAAYGYLQTSERRYEVGVRNELGVVQSVCRDGALVRVRPGVVVRVEAYEGRAVAPTGTPEPWRLAGKK